MAWARQAPSAATAPSTNATDLRPAPPPGAERSNGALHRCPGPPTSPRPQAPSAATAPHQGAHPRRADPRSRSALRDHCREKPCRDGEPKGWGSGLPCEETCDASSGAAKHRTNPAPRTHSAAKRSPEQGSPDPHPAAYSDLNASIGSTRVARTAGTYAAATATAASTTPTTRYVKGSVPST